VGELGRDRADLYRVRLLHEFVGDAVQLYKTD
jgi:hypothetical protein